MVYVKKVITVSPEHQQFIEDRSLNLSKFVQKALDEEIQRQGYRAKK